MTPADLGDTLSEAGLGEGDNILLHSSYRSLRPFAGNPESVVQVLRELIGPRGNLMLPTFNYSSPLPDPYYDPDTTAARTGAIAEACIPRTRWQSSDRKPKR
jgi:aminoglycoside 3-N-acetyltransferase